MEETRKLHCKCHNCEVDAVLSFEKGSYKEYNCPNVNNEGEPCTISKGIHPDLSHKGEKLSKATVNAVGRIAMHKIGSEITEQIKQNKDAQLQSIELLVKYGRANKSTLDQYMRTHGYRHTNSFIKMLFNFFK